MKICSKCRIKRDESKFGKNKNTKDGLSSQCKPCFRKYDAVHKEEHTLRESKRNAKKGGYLQPNITAKEFRTLKAISVFCEICKLDGGEKGLFLDHDHKTGQIRGMLCSTCNTAIGYFKDSPELILKAIQYLKDNDG